MLHTFPFSTRASWGLIRPNKGSLSLSTSLPPAWSDDSVVCHRLPASPWVIASPDTHLLVPLTYPNAQKIKFSAEVIKRVNPGCVLCRRPGCCGGRYYHIKPGAEGITAQHSLITPHLVGIYCFSKKQLAYSCLSPCCAWGRVPFEHKYLES